MIEILKSTGKGILVSTIILITLYALGLNWWQTWIAIMFLNVCFMVHYNRFNFPDFIKTSLIVLSLILLFKFLDGYGWLGFLAIIILSVAYILIAKRKSFISTKHKIETMIWGKPLREFIEAKEDLPKISLSGIRPNKKTKQHLAK